MVAFRYFTLAIFIFNLHFSSHAEGEHKSYKLDGNAREIYKTLREVYKDGGFELVKDEERTRERKKDSGMNLCVSCSELSELVKVVNKSVMKLAIQEDELDPSKRLVEKVSGLDALYHYTYDDSALFSRAKCDRFTHISSDDYEEDDLNLSESKIIFSNDVPVHKINALILMDGKKRSYFYRGKDEDSDIIVRIDVHDKESAKVTYYKFVKPKLSFVSKSEKPKVKKEETWKLWSGEDVEDRDKEHVGYGLGVSIEHRSNIPRKLTLIKGSSITSFSEGLAVKTEAELSTDKQVASIALGAVEGNDFAKIELDKDVAELKFPTRFDLTSVGVKMEAEYSINTEDRQRFSLSLFNGSGTSTKILLEEDEEGVRTGSLLQSHRVSNRQSISLQVEGGESSENKAWLRYNIIF